MLQQIDWTQFTPLLVKADKVVVKKSKIDAKGVVTEDTHKWVLSEVEWKFSPINTPEHIMRIKTVQENGQPYVDPKDVLTEQFDFLSGAFKFYLDDETNSILGEIETTEAGFNVTYRYNITFYGSQSVESKDLLGMCQKTKTNYTNSVIAL